MIPFQDTIPCRFTPWMTWVLMGTFFSAFLFIWLLPDEVRTQIFFLYGLVPARYTHPEWAGWVGLDSHNYLPFLTNLFLHSGWLHLVLNLWLLWIFGDNVEDRMGPWRFLLFFLLCGLLANGVHATISRNAITPAVGASGAIAGVLAAYFYLFPNAKVILWAFPLPLFIRVPAIVFLGLWVILQAYQATTAMMANEPFENVAWWGHLGGFAAGFLLFRLFLRKNWENSAENHVDR
ncbi:rhomboid family intramembrane serine protease [Methylohalobius crimeensis]|uniref:rhomboid family intramembrane serine protease n=1 Tax=Methylohalobius crimeensis TaxID=244365 RepID=UPI0003B75435|nr:rhomboid family intramembrane serine protease [Methylohalobius crimeensis]